MVEIVVAPLCDDIDGGVPGADAAGERCALDAVTLQALGLAPDPANYDFSLPGNRPQVLVTLKEDPAKFVLCTVAKLASGIGGNVEMGPQCLERLFGLRKPCYQCFEAVVDANILSTSQFTEHLAADAGTPLVLLAPHGGAIEKNTDREAERVAAVLQQAGKQATTWICKGTGGRALRRWHITSTDLSERSFPGLQQLMTLPFSYAVAFHGFDEPDAPGDVVIGGRGGRPLRDRLAQTIEQEVGPAIRVHVATSSDSFRFRGTSLHNIVNRLGHVACIQIEQSPAARKDQVWQKIADAVSRVFLED
jgi:phage replication-related protein YjqB (UPF0714/DUF867 family)